MAGGGGVEWYFGWQNNSPHSDLSAEDWRTREGMYRQTRLALDFFHEHLPFHRMEPADDLVVGHGVFALAAPGEVYAIYLPNGGGTRFDLGPQAGLYEVRWFDPRSGGPLREGSLRRVRGPGLAWTGGPPSEPDRDWLALVRRVEETAPATQFPGEEWRRGEPFDLGIEPAGCTTRSTTGAWRRARRGPTGWSSRGGASSSTREGGRRRPGRAVGDEVVHEHGARPAARREGSLARHAAAQLEPLLRERYGASTLRHFATMTSGYSAPGGSRWGEPSEDWSQTPYVPGPPLFLPGSAFAYWDEAQMMLGRVLTRLAGRDLLALLDERVLRPIGARVAGWSAEGDVDGVPSGTAAPGSRSTRGASPASATSS
jgi:hypothetical protein